MIAAADAVFEAIQSLWRVPDDERLARKQGICPVTKMALGSMGKPEKQTVNGRIVFLCCAGCVQALRDSPDKYLPPAANSDTPNERP